MFWCRDSWKMATPTSIKNCWYHTGLMDGCTQSVQSSVEELDTDMEEDTPEDLIKQLTDQPFDLDEYLALDNELEVHQQFTEADILATYIVTLVMIPTARTMMLLK